MVRKGNVREIQRVLQSLAPFGTWGHDLRATAREWANEGFTEDEVRDWLKARSFDAWDTSEMRDAGITPDDAATMTEPEIGFCKRTETLGFKVSDGELTVNDALVVLGRLPVPLPEPPRPSLDDLDHWFGP